MCICLVTIIVMMVPLLMIIYSMMFHFYFIDNPSHVVFDGDMNVDESRTSPNS